MFDALFLSSIYLCTQMLCVWFIYRMTKNPSAVDVAWALGLMVTGLIYLLPELPNTRLMIISIVLAIWGIRLAFYLWFTRIRKGIIDKRYLKLSENWKISKSLGFFLNFQLQGFFILIISSVFLFASKQSANSMSWLDCLGVLLALIGIVGETIADQQLYAFQQGHTKNVCQVGLWRYSRHPNYFFEWLVWCGFSLFGLQHAEGCISLVSPLLLYFIMTRLTGPMTEQGSISSRGQAYLDYQRKTPMFFPFKMR